MPSLRVMLVDDSSRFLSSAGRFLKADPRIHLIGRAFSGYEALEQIPHLAPDLVLMDLAMPGMSGLETTRVIKAQPQPPRVVILTSYDTPEYRTAAEQVGADGFMSKSDFGTLVLPLIDHLYRTLPFYAPME
ncbi:MAG: response regulator transcription factor [Chloroflexaceae bacterium]|nr:response regulator transcription factor [Chloroflexaceae bacterium]